MPDITTEIAAVSAMLADISTELLSEFEQARREYTAEHDDEHTFLDWRLLLNEKAAFIQEGERRQEVRERLKQVVTIAISALLSIDRRASQP